MLHVLSCMLMPWLVVSFDDSAETDAVSLVEKNPASICLYYWTAESEFVDPCEQ